MSVVSGAGRPVEAGSVSPTALDVVIKIENMEHVVDVLSQADVLYTEDGGHGFDAAVALGLHSELDIKPEPSDQPAEDARDPAEFGMKSEPQLELEPSECDPPSPDSGSVTSRSSRKPTTSQKHVAADIDSPRPSKADNNYSNKTSIHYGAEKISKCKKLPKGSGNNVRSSQLHNIQTIIKKYSNIRLKNEYSCTLCKFVTKQEHVLKHHYKMHSANAEHFTCDTCSYITIEKNTLISHIRSHTGDKPYACELCNKKFVKSSNLITHIRTHTGYKRFACKICDKKFNQSSDLKRHKRTHTGKKNFTCTICDKKFSRNSNLNRHLRTHTGEKNFTCKICDKKFSQSGSLKAHTRTHTGEKNFTCKICNKKFLQSCHLKMHITTTHTGEKNFTCEICDKKFTKSNNFKRHFRSHTIFACEICEFVTNKEHVLKNHNKMHSATTDYYIQGVPSILWEQLLVWGHLQKV